MTFSPNKSVTKPPQDSRWLKNNSVFQTAGKKSQNHLYLERLYHCSLFSCLYHIKNLILNLCCVKIAWCVKFYGKQIFVQPISESPLNWRLWAFVMNSWVQSAACRTPQALFWPCIIYLCPTDFCPCRHSLSCGDGEINQFLLKCQGVAILLFFPSATLPSHSSEPNRTYKLLTWNLKLVCICLFRISLLPWLFCYSHLMHSSTVSALPLWNPRDSLVGWTRDTHLRSLFILPGNRADGLFSFTMKVEVHLRSRGLAHNKTP